MTPRRRALLIVGLILALLGLVIFVIMSLRRFVPSAAPEAPIAEEETEEPEEVPVSVQPFQNPLIQEEPVAPGATGSRQMAELFAERYGSYSTQGDYQNLRDLLPVMTASYRRTTEAFLATADASAAGERPFEGVTSVKVSTDVRSSDDDSAIIAVALQQEQTVGGSTTIAYRTLRMELERVGEDWRVDAAAWEN